MSVHVCRPELFQNLCLSLDSGVPHFFFRTTPLLYARGSLCSPPPSTRLSNDSQVQLYQRRRRAVEILLDKSFIQDWANTVRRKTRRLLGVNKDGKYSQAGEATR